MAQGWNAGKGEGSEGGEIRESILGEKLKMEFLSLCVCVWGSILGLFVCLFVCFPPERSLTMTFVFLGMW